MGMFDKRREQLGIKSASPSTVPATKQSSSVTGGESAFERRRSSLQQDKEARRQESIRQAEERQRVTTARPAVSTALPSVEKQLRTATTAFKPSVKTTTVSPEIDRLQKMADANKAAGKRSTAGMSRDDYVAYAKLKQVEAKQQDAMRDKGVVEKTGQFLGQFYTPGAGLGAITAGTQAAGSLLSRVAPSIGRGTGLGATVAREAIKEGAVGVPLAAGQALAQEPGISGRELAKQTILGAGLGAAAGPIGPLLGKGIQSVRNAPQAVLRGALEATNVPQAAAQAIPTQLPSQITRAAVPPAEAMKGNWFTSTFGNQGVGIAAGRAPKGRNALTTEGQIVNNPLRNDIQGFKNQAQSMARTAYTNAFDITNPIKYIDEDAYEMAQDVRRANNLANTSIQDKFVDIEGNVIGPSLKETGNKVARGEGHAFEDYLILRHAPTRMARGENVYDPKLGMTIEKVEERLDMLNKRYPEFSAIANEYDNYNANLRQLGVDGGLLSEAQATGMQMENPHYAPNRRQFTTAEKFSQPFAMKTKGFSGQRGPIKEVSPTGSIRKIVSPIRSTIEQTGAWYNAILRNRVMTQVYDRVKADPESLKGIIEIVPDTAEATKKSIDEVNELLKTDGMEGLMEKLNDELSVMFKKSGQKGARTDNIVTAMIKGTPVKMRVENPEVFKALVGMGPEESNFALDIMGSLSNATKFGATGALAPLFAARSLTTDVATSLIQSKQPLMHMYDLMHSVFSSLANKLPQGTPGAEGLRGLAQDFSRTGGEYSAMLMGDRALNQSVSGILRKPFMAPSNVGKAIVSPVTGTFKALNSISDISENLNRMAAYKGALRRQGNVRTPEAIRNAMRESQEITTNFSRKGAKSEGIEKFIPYSNAAMQGIRRFGVQWKKNPVKTAMAVGGLVIAPKMYEYAMFGDDPDYQKMTAREKYRNIIVNKNADGTFTKIPMPPEYNAIGAAVVDMLVAYKDGDPVNWRQSADAIANAYTPPIIGGALQGLTQGGGIEQSIRGTLGATSVAPFSAITAGEQGQSFTGAPIVPADLLELSAGEQYDERTSIVAKEIGKRIGMAPVKVDYLVKAYGGDPARLLLPLTAQVGAGTPRNTLLKNFIVDPVFSNTLQTDYYDMKKKITEAEEDNEKHNVPLPAWYNETTVDLITASSRKKGSISNQLSDLKAQKEEVQVNKSLNAKQKADQLRDIQAKVNAIYLDANTKMIEAGFPTGR